MKQTEREKVLREIRGKLHDSISSGTRVNDNEIIIHINELMRLVDIGELTYSEALVYIDKMTSEFRGTPPNLTNTAFQDLKDSIVWE